MDDSMATHVILGTIADNLDAATLIKISERIEEAKEEYLKQNPQDTTTADEIQAVADYFIFESE